MKELIDGLASISIFTVPFLLGGILGGGFLIRFLRGVLLLGVIYALSYLLGSFLPFGLTLRILLWGTILTGLILAVRRGELGVLATHLKLVRIRHVVTFGVLLFFAWYSFFWLFRSLTPYPYMLNWDTYEHITLARQILAGNVHFFPTQISDTFTFNGYTPLFHMLLTLPVVMFQASFIGTYYFSEWWFYLFVIALSIFMAYRLFRTETAAFLGGICAIFVFASAVVYIPLFFLPQTLASLLSVAALFSLKMNRMRDIADFLTVCVGIFLLHFVIGLAGVGIVCLWYGNFWLARRGVRFFASPKFIYYSFLLSACIFFLLMALHLSGGIRLTSREEAAYYQFSLSQLWQFMKQWYGLLGIFLLPVGFYSLLASGRRQQGVFACLSFLVLAVSFAPFSYALKFFALGWFFANLILIAGAEKMLSYLPPVLGRIAIGILGLTLLISFYVSQVQYKQYLYHAGKEAHFSSRELDAAEFLKQQGNVFLISDPATQGVLEALGHANSQGGVYMNLKSRQILSRLPTVSPLGVPLYLSRIEDMLPVTQPEKRMLVLSGRYFKWQQFSQKEKESVYFNVWRPYFLNQDNKNALDIYIKAGQKIVYQNEEMIIFAL